jgi:hypothetical protein
MINALLSLSCAIYAGSGSLTIVSGIVESPRYQNASITIQMDEDQVLDIRVNGPWDRDWSYRDHGFALHADRSEGRWILSADSPKDLARETLVLEDNGRLLWSQVADVPALKTAEVSIFSGSCSPTSSDGGTQKQDSQPTPAQSAQQRGETRATPRALINQERGKALARAAPAR